MVMAGNDAEFKPTESGTTPQSPQTHSDSPSASVGNENPLQNDIAKILSEVKLPERRNPVVPTRQYDTGVPQASQTSRVDIAPITAPHDPSKPSVADIALGVHEKEADVRPLHTLKDDLQNVVKEKKISLVRAAALEEEKRHRVSSKDLAQAVATRPKKFGIAVFSSFILVGLGILALATVFIVMQERSGTSSTALGTNALLFSEQSIPLPLDELHPNDVRRSLGALREQTVLTLGAIMQVVPTIQGANPMTNEVAPRPVTFGEFIQSIGANPPAELIRSVENDFFFGIHTVDERAPILVLQVKTYERAFAAMLEWEERMNADLTPVFTTVPRQTTSPDGAITERLFEDAIMRNYDVRQLKDDQGTVQLYYSFPSRNILIIAESPYSFTEVLSRLRADRRL